MVTSDDGFGATIDAPKEPHKKEPFKAQISLDWAVLEQAEATAALATADYVSITPSFADSTGRFVDIRLQRGAS